MTVDDLLTSAALLELCDGKFFFAVVAAAGRHFCSGRVCFDGKEVFGNTRVACEQRFGRVAVKVSYLRFNLVSYHVSPT